MTRLNRTLSLLALLLLALSPAVAEAKKKKSKLPTISTVSPKNVRVGEKLVITGKNFRKGAGKTRVYFIRGKGKLAWAKSDSGTKRRLVVTVPETITEHLRRDGNEFLPTRFQLRLLTKRFGKATRTSRSPLVSALGSTDSGNGGTPEPTNTPEGDCDADGIKNNLETDDDNDLLLDSTEDGLTKTDPCDVDTDGDAVEDGYEFESALDMNNNPNYVLPYPGKRPYPNALNADALVDHDGDGLYQIDEYNLWIGFGGRVLPLNYSDGTQTTETSQPNTLPEQKTAYDACTAGKPQNRVADALIDHELNLDADAAGQLRDDERDADCDGLTNWDEAHGKMTQDWWDARYLDDPKKETRYTRDFAPVNLADPDSDGDGLWDGNDDHDNDGFSNAWEVMRPDSWCTDYVSTGPYPDCVPSVRDNPFARTQPFNPCKPIFSETCHRHPPFEYYDDNEDFLSPCEPHEMVGPFAPGVTPAVKPAGWTIADCLT